MLSCCFVLGAGDQRRGLLLSIPDALFGKEPPPPSRGFSFESRLKPEKNKEKKGGAKRRRKKKHHPKNPEVKSMGWGARRPPSSSSGLAACAGLGEDFLSQRLNNSGSKPEHAEGLWVCGAGPPGSINRSHSNQTQGRAVFLSVSAQVRSAQTPTGPGNVSSPWAPPSGACAGTVLLARGCPLAPPHSSQGLMSVSMATQLYAA